MPVDLNEKNTKKDKEKSVETRWPAKLHMFLISPVHFLRMIFFSHIFFLLHYSTTYNAYRDYNTNNVHIIYEANYKKYQAILRLNTTEKRRQLLFIHEENK